MRQINIEDLAPLGLGNAILGSGGGGDPAYDIKMACSAIKTYGPPALIDVEDLDDEALVVPVAFIGSTLVEEHHLASGKEFSAISTAVEARYGKKISAVIALEVGGGNGVVPVRVAAELRVPIVDGDGIGRAFPELQMTAFNLAGISCSPAFLADTLGNTVVIEAEDALELEAVARKKTIEMGSSAAIAFYVMTGKEAKKAVVRHSISQALAMGRSLLEAKGHGEDPIERLIGENGGRLVGEGVIVQIEQEVAGGFLTGKATLENGMEIHYKNEYLMVCAGGERVGLTPDIIALLEVESASPVTSDCLREGMQVRVVLFPAPSVWQTPEGLALVGPDCFELGPRIPYFVANFSKKPKTAHEDWLAP